MGKRKEFQGLVIGDKMKKTVVVKVIFMSKHAKYSRIMKSHKKFKAHDENQEAHIGDLVLIEETRPISKEKRFRVKKIIEKAKKVLEIKEEAIQ